ncbi:hypothetical protein [Vibrio crassostreae]|uniref:hypothetical protein n=1 Tax=Vibrio crassostreae TaxID=246167 RepID=UPI001B312D13|nr:hypothetical protein [Vibrio crassostreae]
MSFTPKKMFNIQASKALSQKLKYIDLEYVEELFGKYCPINSNMLAHIIDEALDNINQGYSVTTSKRRFKSEDPAVSQYITGSIDKLLKHNKTKKSHPWDLCGDFDFDITHESHDRKDDIPDNPIQTYIHPFFTHPEYARPKHEVRVLFRLLHHTFEGTSWGIVVPVQLLMKGAKRISNCHFGYGHQICVADGNDYKEYHYIGITKRNWLQRMSEHFNEVRTGSNKTFHKAWREFTGKKNVTFTSELIVYNHNYKQIMDWEEFIVDQCMANGNSLNMIPGGFKGLRFLHEHRITDRERISLEERDVAISDYQRLNPNKGVPNLMVSKLWCDQDYVNRVICGHSNRLTVEQVLEIRRLSAKHDSAFIMKQLGLNDRSQVERVMRGKTYNKVAKNRLSE